MRCPFLGFRADTRVPNSARACVFDGDSPGRPPRLQGGRRVRPRHARPWQVQARGRHQADYQ